MKEIREFCEFQHSRFSLVRFHDFFANFLSQKITLIFHSVFFSNFGESLHSCFHPVRFHDFFLEFWQIIAFLLSSRSFSRFFSRILANHCILAFIPFVFTIFFSNFGKSLHSCFHPVRFHDFFLEFWQIIAFLLSSRSFLRFFANLI